MNITERALELVQTGAIRRDEDARVYVVPSQTDAETRYYLVVLSDEIVGPSCFQLDGAGKRVCPSHQHHGVCKHILAATLIDQERRAAEAVR